MGSGKKKKQESGITSDTILYDSLGNEIHLLNGKNGPMLIRKETASIWLQTGEEYCPDCHCLMEHRDGYWECADCKHSITDEESADGEGCPTLEASYAHEYDDYFTPARLAELMEPEVCSECGGPWPECQSGCRLFRD
jgi:ribosomal protein L37AE/L43A